MFLARSAFWLTVAYMAIGPGPIDLGGAANRLSAEALAAGRNLVVSQILAGPCAPTECPGPMAGTIVPSVDNTMQDSSNPVPLPRRRPDRMG